MANKPTPKTKPQRKAPTRIRVPKNITVLPELADLAEKFLPGTKFKTLSGFLESKLEELYRRHAVKIRKLGIVIPERIFEKK